MKAVDHASVELCRGSGSQEDLARPQISETQQRNLIVRNRRLQVCTSLSTSVVEEESVQSQ
jgi:hypothetical protein